MKKLYQFNYLEWHGIIFILLMLFSQFYLIYGVNQIKLVLVVDNYRTQTSG